MAGLGLKLGCTIRNHHYCLLATGTEEYLHPRALAGQQDHFGTGKQSPGELEGPLGWLLGDSGAVRGSAVNLMSWGYACPGATSQTHLGPPHRHIWERAELELKYPQTPNR